MGDVVSAEELPIKVKAFIPLIIREILLLRVYTGWRLVCTKDNYRVLYKCEEDDIMPLFHCELELPPHYRGVGMLANGMAVKDSTKKLKLT